MEVWWSFPTMITFLLCRVTVWPSRQRDRQKFLDVGFLVGRVLTLVFCLLVWTIFLRLYKYQRLDHHPQTLNGRGQGGVVMLLISHSSTKNEQMVLKLQ